MSWSEKRLSKFLSLLLRHRPQEIGLRLDAGGWARIEQLVRKARARAGAPLSRERILELVERQDRPRFTLGPHGDRIRANYGHSVDVDLDLTPCEPPTHLFHGTAERSLEAILRSGLEPGSRLYVHLSRDPERAGEVGRRHGPPVVLRVRAGAMHRDDHTFYRATRGIWLTERVPAEFLESRE